MVGMCAEKERQPLRQLRVRGKEEVNECGNGLVRLRNRNDSTLLVCFNEEKTLVHDGFGVLRGAVQKGAKKRKVERE